MQDLASQWVAAAVGAAPGERVADLCAAPGGKATALAATGATVIAADIRKARVGLVRGNAPRLPVLAADAARPPFPPGSFDHVLLDAPCSGLGTLRRRPDARWRIDAASPERLAAVQRSLVDAAVPLLRPGGTLIYSVCTLTDAETVAIDDHLASSSPTLLPLAPPDGPWEAARARRRLLPQSAGTDGMYLLRLRAPP